jgi:hypothetical protein
MPKKIVKEKKCKSQNCTKKSYNDKCIVLIHKIQKLLKEAKKENEKKSSKKTNKNKKNTKKVKKMVGGDNFIKDIQRAGKGLSLAMTHTFDSMNNLGKDMYCETDAIMNIPNELDMKYTQECPFTKTKSWEWENIKQ